MKLQLKMMKSAERMDQGRLPLEIERRGITDDYQKCDQLEDGTWNIHGFVPGIIIA